MQDMRKVSANREHAVLCRLQISKSIRKRNLLYCTEHVTILSEKYGFVPLSGV